MVRRRTDGSEARARPNGLLELVVGGEGDDVLLVVDIRHLEGFRLVQVEGARDALRERGPSEVGVVLAGLDGETADVRAEVELDNEALRGRGHLSALWSRKA